MYIVKSYFTPRHNQLKSYYLPSTNYKAMWNMKMAMTKSRTKGKSLSLCWGYGEACVGLCVCVWCGRGIVRDCECAEGHVLVMDFLDFCRTWLNDPEGRRSERVCLYSHIVTLLFIWRSGRDALLKKPMRWEACRRFHCAWWCGAREENISAEILLIEA